MMVDETSVPPVKLGQKATLASTRIPTEVHGHRDRGRLLADREERSGPARRWWPTPRRSTSRSRSAWTSRPTTIRPGFSVTAEIVTGRTEGTTAIPIQALVVRDVPRRRTRSPRPASRPETEEGVYVVKDGKLGFQKVETGIAGELMVEVKSGPKAGRRDRHRPLQGPAPGQGRRQGPRREPKAKRRARRADRIRRDDPRALPRLVGGADAPQAARVPDAAGRHHRRGDGRRRRLGDLGPEHLRQGQGHRVEPRHRHLRQVRDHHEPRGVADRDEAHGPHADGHGDRPARVQALRSRSAAGASAQRRSSTATRSSPTSRSRATRRTGRGDELRHRDRPLLHASPSTTTRRPSASSAGTSRTSCSRSRPDRPHHEDRRLSGQGHRHARQAGHGHGAEPGQRGLHAPDALQEPHRPDVGHRDLHQAARAASQASTPRPTRCGRSSARCARRSSTRTIRSASSRRSCSRPSGGTSRRERSC